MSKEKRYAANDETGKFDQSSQESGQGGEALSGRILYEYSKQRGEYENQRQMLTDMVSCCSESEAGAWIWRLV